MRPKISHFFGLTFESSNVKRREEKEKKKKEKRRRRRRREEEEEEEKFAKGMDLWSLVWIIVWNL